MGQVPVVLGVPADWDGTGDYPVAQVEVFAVDRPVDFDGGVFGIGFGIDGHADGGTARNRSAMSDHGERLNDGYIVSTRGVDVGLTAANTAGFAFIALDRNDLGRGLAATPRRPLPSAPSAPNGFAVNLPILVDTGIKAMILWVGAGSAPPELASGSSVPDGVKVSLLAPPADPGLEPALQYGFVTGDASQPMAPSQVEWRMGHGINTGRNVQAGADYLYDATAGRIGFRVPPL